MTFDSWNHGQACCAGSRIFVQAGIYDEFLKRFSAKASSINVGDPFGLDVDQGPQVSQIQYDVRFFFYFSGATVTIVSIAYYGIHRVWEEGWGNALSRR